MEYLEMVETLREKTGVSYEDARNALEAADYNMLDAIVYLEQQVHRTLLLQKPDSSLRRISLHSRTARRSPLKRYVVILEHGVRRC